MKRLISILLLSFFLCGCGMQPEVITEYITEEMSTEEMISALEEEGYEVIESSDYYDLEEEKISFEEKYYESDSKYEKLQNKIDDIWDEYCGVFSEFIYEDEQSIHDNAKYVEEFYDLMEGITY